MQWADKRKHFEALSKKGQAPKAFETKPELYPDLIPVWRGFLALHTARGQGFGITALSICEIKAWLDLHELDYETKMEYFHLFKAMDNHWLENQPKK